MSTFSLLIVLGILVLIFVMSAARKRRRTRSEPVIEADEPVPTPGPVVSETPPQELGRLGALTVLASDDRTMIGRRFEVTRSLTSLGRRSDNDVAFPKDRPVSRQHAQIYMQEGSFYLRNITSQDDSGETQLPKYGTFLNGHMLGAEAAPLENGDFIQLGEIVRLRFEDYRAQSDSGINFFDRERS